MTPLLPPVPNPCGSCPYRRDVPSGIWARKEYVSLPEYDKPTWDQPVGLFLCHQQTGRACAGWCGTHNMTESLAFRIASIHASAETLDAILNYTTDTPLFASGREACDHGLRDLKTPGEKAVTTITALRQKRAIRKRKPK